MQRLRQFWPEESGAVITTEYMVFVVAIVILLAMGVWALMGGLEALFSAYTNYFRPPS